MFRKYQLFCTIVQTQNITKAAEVLHISQPSVSVALQELEAHYQTKFFRREGKKLVLTDEGLWLNTHALEVLHRTEEIENHFKNTQLAQHFIIGASVSVGNSLLAALIESFQKDHPSAQLRVIVDSSSILESALIKNELDVALLEGVITDKRIISSILYRDRYVLICSATNPVEIHSLAQLGKHPFLAREKQSGTRQLVDMMMSASGVRLNMVWESQSPEAIIQAVHTGLGLSILPYHVVKEAVESKLIKIIPLKEIEYERIVNVAIGNGRGKSNLADQLLQTYANLIHKKDSI